MRRARVFGQLPIPDTPDSTQCVELFYSESCLTNDRSQGASVEFDVIRNRQLCKRVRPPDNNMRTFLPNLAEAGSGQDRDAVTARDPRQLAHTATIMASSLSSGTGMPSS